MDTHLSETNINLSVIKTNSNFTNTITINRFLASIEQTKHLLLLYKFIKNTSNNENTHQVTTTTNSHFPNINSFPKATSPIDPLAFWRVRQLIIGRPLNVYTAKIIIFPSKPNKPS